MSPSHRPVSAQDASRLTSAAAALGYEIVDIAGFLDLVEAHAHAQTDSLNVLRARASEVATANADVLAAARKMADHTTETASDVEDSVARMRRTGDKSRDVAGWVKDVSTKTEHVAETLTAVKSNNHQIASIATQVNTLAINAKIEAARAGESGRGFAVVAEAINELSQQTRRAATEISNNIETLTAWISDLREEANTIAEKASEVLDDAGGTDKALVRVEASVTSADKQAQRISDQALKVQNAMADFSPALARIKEAVVSTTSGVEETHARVLRLIDTSETIVQSTAHADAQSVDAPFIKAAQKLASDAMEQMERAVRSGQITMAALFDRNYRLIPDTNPEQYLTGATQLMDSIMPPIQEPALQIDPKVVFCAAVDVNGYLPTHNRIFSQPQSDDPVWNMANCRNRRIFNDRVGFKAGRNSDPFLLQVYRRDMGGGTFKMMKDLSVPLFVQGHHWGGLRLAYSFE